MEAPALENLIGQEVLTLIPMLHPSTPTKIVIHAVEVGGIWIEHGPMSQKIMRDTKQPVSENTPVLFVPYSGIGYVVGSVEKTLLSESALLG